MLEFKLFGIPIRIEPDFWMIMGLFGFLSNQSLNLSGNQLLLRIALFMLAAFISILIHELGHALMIKKYKLPTQIKLSLFRGSALLPDGILDRKQSFLVSLGGPLLQALFGIILYFLQPPLAGTLLDYFFDILIGISLFWAAINCIPIIPLDGGHMLHAALGPRRIKLTLTICVLTGIVITILCLIIGFYFFGVFLAMYTYTNYQNLERYK